MFMTTKRPYLIRALHEWILVNNCTPYILVDTFIEGVEVPQEYVKDGQIVLNISPQAITNLLIDDEAISFQGRFSGIPMKLYIPITSVISIYAKENGQGMVFDIEDPLPKPPGPRGLHSLDGSSASKEKSGKKGSANKPTLRVVK